LQSGRADDEVLPGGAALRFSSTSGVERIVYNEKTGRYEFKMVEGTYEFFVHLAAQNTAIQTGANEKETLRLDIRDVSSSALGLDRLYVTDAASAKRAITLADNAISLVSAQRARLGAYQNRLEHAAANLTAASTNLTGAESRIRDADMAQETLDFTRLQILLQSGTAMLGQANQAPQNVLSLLRGQ
jgi:flagellin